MTNLNAALESAPELQGKSVEDLIADLNAFRKRSARLSATTAAATLTIPCSGKRSARTVAARLPVRSPMRSTSELGGFEKFKADFAKAATTRFGCGWAWLAVGKDGKLKVYSLPNQDSPIMEGDTPILGLDVWEHAYYLKYQNKRPDYIAAFWNVVNWAEVGKRY